MSLVRVRSYQDRTQAHLAQRYLESHDLEAIVLGDDALGTSPHVAFGTARIALLVPESEARESLRLLDTLETREARPSGRPPHLAWLLVGLLVAVTVGSIVVSIVG